MDKLTQELLHKLEKRIKARDGLAINAEVWTEAHDYHYQQQRAHQWWGHGVGIMTGLEVTVDDETGQVLVEPGAAIDATGRLIVLSAQDPVNIDTSQPGLMYIYLLGGDEHEVNNQGQLRRDELTYLRIGYHQVPAFTLPDGAVELARVRITRPNDPIQAAKNWAQPKPHEIDLRYRRPVGVNIPPTVGVGIVYLGQQNGRSLKNYAGSAAHLARALSHLTHYRVWIDDDVGQADSLSYTLIYVVERGGYTPDPDFMEELQAHRENGGVIFVENQGNDSPLLAEFARQQLQFKPEPIEALLTDPFLFSQLPEGANPTGKIWFADGVIISARNYGALWQRSQGTREEIRSAVEWGANLVTYALKRRGQ